MSLGKGYAVGRLLGIMDNKRLKAPKSPIWPELRKELMAFELTATSMHDRYGASPGQHDDLITRWPCASRRIRHERRRSCRTRECM